MEAEKLIRSAGDFAANVAQTIIPDFMQRAAARMLKDQVIAHEVIGDNRSYNLGAEIVAHTLGEEFRPLTEEELAFKATVGNFLNPKAEMDLDSQLEVMNELYDQLGYKPPELDDDQKTQLQETLDNNPGSRVVPTPLLDLAGRIHIVDMGQHLPANRFDIGRLDKEHEHLLWEPGKGLYGTLLRQDTLVYDNEPRITWALGYKTENGLVVDRAGYIDWLKTTGQAVVDKDGMVWTYPVMDVRVESERSQETAAKLHEQVDPIISSEALIVMNLLHQANGTPNNKWGSDFANEAVYGYSSVGIEAFSKEERVKYKMPGLDEEGKFVHRVARVRWERGFHYIELSGVDNTDEVDGRFGIRKGTSGIFQ